MTDFETVETWKKRLGLTDQDILTEEHLNRVAAQGPAQESEIVYCACGCGEFWLRSLNYKGRKFRYSRGHTARAKKRRYDPRIISHKSQKEIIQLIFEALPTGSSVNTVTTIAKKTSINREVVLHNLKIIDLVLELQPGRWLESVKVEGMKNVSKVFRRKSRRGEGS